MRRILAGAIHQPHAISPAERQVLPPALVRMTVLALTVLAALGVALPRCSRAEWTPNGNVIARPVLLPTVRLAPDANGGVYVAWDAGATGGLLLGRVLADGQMAPDWPKGPPPGFRLFPYPWWGYPQSVIEDGDGGAFAVEEAVDCAHSCGGDYHVVLATRVLASPTLAPGWPADGVQLGIGGNNKSRPQIATDGDGQGGVLAAWSVAPIPYRLYSPREVRAQRVDGSGKLLWGSGGTVVQAVTDAYNLAVTIVADGRGGAFVFWLDPTGTRILGQRLSPTGRPLWASPGSVIADGRGSIVGAYRVIAAERPDGATLAWIAGSSGGGVLSVTRIRGDGNFRTETVARSLPADALVSMVPCQSGGAVLAWSEALGDTNRAILAQRFNHGGQPLWSKRGVLVSCARSQKSALKVVSDGSGGAYLAWGDSRREAEVYAMHLNRWGDATRGWRRDGAPLCGQTRGLHAVELVADGEQAAFVAWTDERRAPDGSYLEVVASLMRLTPAGPAAEPTMPEQDANVHGSIMAARGAGPGAGLAVEMVEPGLIAGAGAVQFSLGSASPASLAMIDVAGRRMWSREVGSLGAGEHRLGLAGTAWVPSGVYFVRLTQGGRVASARVAIIH